MATRFVIPKYIDIEDKIAFRLTLKQLGWFSLSGVVLFLIWQVFNLAVFIFWAVLIIPLSVALSFWQPFGMSFPTLIWSSFLYLIRPKKLFWFKQFEKRDIVSDNFKKKDKKRISKDQEIRKKQNLMRQVDNLADILDEGGSL